MMMNLEQVAAKALARLLKKCHQKEAPCDRRFLALFISYIQYGTHLFFGL